MSYYEQSSGSVVAGALWMLFLSIILFWLPVIGPLIAGFVGGRVAGSTGNGFLAAILPAIVIAVLILIIGSIFSLPFIGAIVGVSIFFGIVAHSIWIIIGAVIGGALAH
jgi:hypothetical protein